jgi:two-component system nitrate/nitrite response regulator NarL
MTILIIDDHRLFVDGLTPLLKRLKPRTQVRQAQDLAQGLALIAQGAHPDLILLDISLPGLSGLDGLSRLRDAAPTSPVILLSSVDDPFSVRAAFQRGAQGFLSKSISGREMVAGLREIMDGKAVVKVPEARENAAGPALTPRQLDVLALLAEGLSNKAIAQKLGVAPNTVGTHLAAIFRALRAETRTQAVVNAQRLGMLRHDP